MASSRVAGSSLSSIRMRSGIEPASWRDAARTIASFLAAGSGEAKSGLGVPTHDAITSAHNPADARPNGIRRIAPCYAENPLDGRPPTR